MATSSEVKAGLDDISATIRQLRFEMKRCKVSVTNTKTALTNLPTQYADVVATVQAFGTTNAFEALSKAELTKLTAEYQALLAAVTQAETDLAALTEF